MLSQGSPVLPCETFDPLEIAMVQGGYGQAVGRGGCRNEEIEVTDLLADFFLARLHPGKAFPDFRPRFQDFETSHQQFPVAAPETLLRN